MPSLREQALAPMSRADAERLLPALAGGRQTLERRVLRARCLKTLESFDVAWAELSALLPQLRDPLLAARVATDLIHLTYYLVRPAELRRLERIADRPAAAAPLLLAELRLGRSISATAANEITDALRHARWADDALAAAPRGRARDLIATRVGRQLAHVLSHAGDHVAARAAAEGCARNAIRVADPWEIAWATYTSGFVEWMAGSNERAVGDLTRAEAGLRTYGSSVWRYTLLCLARAKMERGDLAEGDRLARQSATGTPEDLAHLALLRGEAAVAERILERAGAGLPPDEHFRSLVRGITLAQRGDPKRGVRYLEEGSREFESRGMGYWAHGAAMHAAYWREQLVRGGGSARAIQLVREMTGRGAQGFAYYLPAVGVWAGRLAERAGVARDTARILRAAGEAALRRAESDAAIAVGASALDEATFHLRMLGLTWREVAILRELDQAGRLGGRVPRASLAKRLGVRPNTLRVHLTRIRAKLDVGDRRGDEVLLDAALRTRAG